VEIVDNKSLLIRTKYPDKIKEAIGNVVITRGDESVYEVKVAWGIHEAQILRSLNLKGVPSPILRDYAWPGVHPPMEHQRKTAEFLTLNRRAFCFNEQGTGKTASAIWASDYLMDMGIVRRVLVVCPLSVMQSAWQSDLFKFAVHRSVNIAHGTQRKRKEIINGDAEYIIINYDGVEIVREEILSGSFDLIIIDEANAYKNSRTNRFKVMRSLLSYKTRLWMMTGTPASQSPLDAYGLAKLCIPDRAPLLYVEYRDSVMHQLSRFKWVPKPGSADIVHKLLQPAIRFTKEECLDLPEQLYVSRYAPMTPQQSKFYAQMKKDFILSAIGEDVSAVNAAANLTKLLQVACGAVYTDSGNIMEFDASNRLRVLQEVVDEASHKVLVFAPFTHTLTIIKEYLMKNKTAAEIIDGSVPVKKRTELITRFQEQDDIKVLIIQPQAASHGITLTAANIVIWYAPVTSIESYLQANARAHRQGQKNPVTVVHIEGSPVESKLYDMLSSKIELHNKIITLYEKEMAE